jgi:sulfite exporter TauE/SafE
MNLAEVNMSEGQNAEQTTTDFEQLKLLFDYTKFHIGLYTTIATIFGALVAAGSSDRALFKFNMRFLFLAVIFMALAGIAGGVVASSIPQYRGYRAFWAAWIGPMRWRALKAEYWTYIEHTMFWISVFLAIASIALKLWAVS